MNELLILQEALSRCKDFTQLCDEVLPLFTDFARSGEVERRLLQDLQTVAGQMPVGGTRRGVFFENRSGRLACGLALSSPPQTLDGTAAHALTAVISGGVILHRYRHLSGADPSVLNRQCVPNRMPDVALNVGDTFVTEAWWDVVEPYGDALLLVLQTAPYHTTQWIYDRDTLRPRALAAGNRALARMTDALNILAHTGTSEDADVCVTLASHRSHAVRWAAVQTAHVLGHPAAPALLQSALVDPHPEIRAAAASSLESV